MCLARMETFITTGILNSATGLPMPAISWTLKKASWTGSGVSRTKGKNSPGGSTRQRD